MKNTEMIALGLAALAVYFVMKARKSTATAPAEQKATNGFDDLWFARPIPTTREKIFT